MQFFHDGQSYRLEFKREHKRVRLVRDSREKEVNSKYPYTTVSLFELKVGVPKRLLRSATVGCFTHDHYNPEDGRRFALRALIDYYRRNTVIKGDKESKDRHRQFAAAIWEAYLTRNVPKVSVTNEQKLLPEQTATSEEAKSS